MRHQVASALSISIEWAQESEDQRDGQGEERAAEDVQYLDGPEDALLGGWMSCCVTLPPSTPKVWHLLILFCV